MNTKPLSKELHDSLKSKTKEEIYQTLLAKGYTLAEVENFTSETNSSKQTIPQKNNYSSSSQTIYIIAIFGAVLLGLGIFSLIVANWDSIPDFTKVLIVLFITILLHGLGLLADFKIKIPTIANALYLGGSLTFGGTLFLISQLYTLPFKLADFYFIWFIGVSCLGLALKNFVQEYVGLFVLVLASTFSFGFIYGFYLSREANNNNFSTIILSLICAIISIYWAKTLRLRNPDSTLNNIY